MASVLLEKAVGYNESSLAVFLAGLLNAFVISPSNTTQEMDRKRRDYFAAGVRLVWYVDPVNRTVQVFTAVQQSTVLHDNATLSGDPVLPGFVLSLRDLFAQLEQ